MPIECDVFHWSASHVFISLNNRKDAVLGATYMTKEGYEKLKKELDYLLRVRRKEIAASLAHAREFGDLSENAEYEVAKQEQQMNEQKIGTISAKLSNIMIIDNVDIPKDKAYIGANVTIRDTDSGEEVEYMLVSDAEADYMEKKISVTSPVGKGLLGHKVNDEVEIEVPSGTLRYKILKITR